MNTTEQAVVSEVPAGRPGYIKTWGKIFSEFGKEGREICIQKMLEIFPEREDGIKKWADWYKAYFNMGKILGYENPTKISWKKIKA